MSYQKICVPIALQRYLEFTPVALRQRDIALALASKFDSEVHFLAVDAPIALLPDLESTDTKLQRFAENVEGAIVVLREGKPSSEILDYIEEVHADLVIVGSHSKRGPIDVGIGSTASVLSRKSPAPVVMVWPTEDEVDRAKELKIPHYPIIFPYG